MARKSSENRSNGTGATSPGPRPGPGSATGPGSEPGSGLGNQRGTEPGPTPGPCPGTVMGLRARARRMVRDAWRAPDRLMHAHRRATLLARLRESAPPRRILFVCHGNIIRSPFAEHLARAWLPPPLRGKIEFASAGFIGPGRPPPPEAIETALLWDIDLSSHRSRLLSVEELAYADLVLVVEPRQRRAVQRLGCPACRIALLGDLDPQPVASPEIVDPF